jgi:hypothetical protein
MQDSIIVYENPMEKAMWEWQMRGGILQDSFVFITSLAVFYIMTMVFWTVLVGKTFYIERKGKKISIMHQFFSVVSIALASAVTIMFHIMTH